jgi:putative SOS response-associated peptidase YedK
MCGRYSNTRTNPQAIAARFKITISDAAAERALGRTNIAPTQPVLALINEDNGERQATPRAIRTRVRVGEAAWRPIAAR